MAVKIMNCDGWFHPIFTCIVVYSFVSGTMILAHDWILGPIDHRGLSPLSMCAHQPATVPSDWIATATLLEVYALWQLFWRLLLYQKSFVLYEYCWLCNISLHLSAFALVTNRPTLAATCCVTVGIDQLLWYVDLAGYILTNHFPIGVAKYVVQQPWLARITSTHHLWMIPVLLNKIRFVSHEAWLLSIIFMTTTVLLSRVMIPLKVPSKILNVNLAHNFWSDVKLPLLQIDWDHPPAGQYLFRLLWRWCGFNGLVYLFLRWVCQVAFPRNK